MAASLGAANPAAGKCRADAHTLGAQHFVCRVMLCLAAGLCSRPSATRACLLGALWSHPVRAVQSSRPARCSTDVQAAARGVPPWWALVSAESRGAACGACKWGGALEEAQHTEAGGAARCTPGGRHACNGGRGLTRVCAPRRWMQARLRAAASGRLERTAEAYRAHRGQAADSRAERDSGQASPVCQAASERQRGRASGGPGGGGAFLRRDAALASGADERVPGAGAGRGERQPARAGCRCPRTSTAGP
jgi:hypothetical protein